MREVEGGPQSQLRLILLAQFLRVISDTGLIAFTYCAISEHHAQQP